jgi:hypothetical protein
MKTTLLALSLTVSFSLFPTQAEAGCERNIRPVCMGSTGFFGAEALVCTNQGWVCLPTERGVDAKLAQLVRRIEQLERELAELKRRRK